MILLVGSTSKISIPSQTQTIEQTKSTHPSAFKQWKKPEEKHRESFHIAQQVRSSNRSISPPLNTKDNQKATPGIPNIIAAPSFSLRSTAVCNFPPDHYLLSERTQSIHKDISIFKYCLTQKEAQQTVFFLYIYYLFNLKLYRLVIIRMQLCSK